MSRARKYELIALKHTIALQTYRREATRLFDEIASRKSQSLTLATESNSLSQICISRNIETSCRSSPG